MTESEALSLPPINKVKTSDAERLKNMTRHTAEFIVNFEIAEKKLDEWEQRLYQQEERVQQQLATIQESTDELRAIMTEAGAARWRLAAEQALSFGKEHIQLLKELSEEQVKMQRERNEHFMRLAKKTFERLDRASEHTIKNIKDAISTFNPTEMRQIAERHREILESTSSHAISSIHKLHKWFHWKSLAFAAVITLFTSVSVGLYVQDELPWESHKQVALQRTAGKALIDIWPELSEATKQQILQRSSETEGLG